MDQSKTAVHIDDSDVFSTTVRCSVPGDGVDVRRPEEFKATFELIDQEEYEELTANEPKSAVVRRVLRAVDSKTMKPKRLEDGTELSLVETVIRHPTRCDAAFTAYWLYTSQDGRDNAIAAAERKNSRRSRKR